MRGRVVVLNFWGPWCPACLLELPSLMAMQQPHAAGDGSGDRRAEPGVA